MDDAAAIEWMKSLRELTAVGPEAEVACDVAVSAIDTLAKIRRLFKMVPNGEYIISPPELGVLIIEVTKLLGLELKP